MNWLKSESPKPEPVVYATCPNVECKSDLSATVRLAESVTLGVLPEVRARGTVRVCLECGEMYVVAAGRVFRHHASARVASGTSRMASSTTMPNAPAPARVPNISDTEP